MSIDAAWRRSGLGGGRTSRLVVLTGLLVGAVLAVALARFPAGSILPLAVVLMCGGAGLVARRGLRPGAAQQPISETRSTVSLDWRDRAFRTPRFFFYLGLLTIAQLSIRLPFGNLTLSDLFFLVSLLLTAAVILSTRFPFSVVIPRSQIWLGVFLLTMGGLLSSFAALHQLSSVATLARLDYLTAIWFVLGAVVLVRRDHIERAIQLWIISAAITGAAAIVQLLFGNVIPSTTIVYGRMTGFTQHVNDLGGVTSIALAPAIMFAMDRSQAERVRLAARLSTVLLGAGLLLSGSVGGMIAAGAAVLVLLTSSRSIGGPLIILSVFGLVASLTFASSTNTNVATPLKRFAVATGSEGPQKNTLSSRLTTFREGWQRITNDPITGVGLGPANGTLHSGFQIHNMVLGFWVEGGIFAAAGMLVILFSVGNIAVRNARRAADYREWRLSLALGASFAAFIAFGMGAPVVYQRYGWVSAALILAMGGRQGSHSFSQTLRVPVANSGRQARRTL